MNPFQLHFINISAATQAIKSLHVLGQKIPDERGTDDVEVGKVDYAITG